jgi:hypothetical protein
LGQRKRQINTDPPLHHHPILLEQALQLLQFSQNIPTARIIYLTILRQLHLAGGPVQQAGRQFLFQLRNGL